VLEVGAASVAVRGGVATGGRRLADLWCVEGQSWPSVCGVGQVREADGSTKRGEGRR
jgi:hypothetical protein